MPAALAAAFVVLDPMDLNLVPALSRSPTVLNIRAEVRTWPLIAELFDGARRKPPAAAGKPGDAAKKP